MEILCITAVFAVLAFFGAYIELSSRAVERFNGTKTLPAVASSIPMLDITTTTIIKKVVIIIEQPYEHAYMQDVTARPTIDPPAVASASLTKNISSQHEMLSVPLLTRPTSANAAPLPASVTATLPATPPTATLQYGQSSDIMFEKSPSTFLLSNENMEHFFTSVEAALSNFYCKLADPWCLYGRVRDIVQAATNTRTHSTRASRDSTAESSTTSSRTAFTWLPWTPPAACLWLLASRRRRQRALGAISGILHIVQSVVLDIPSLLDSLFAVFSVAYNYTAHHLHQVLRGIHDVPWLDIMVWLLSVIVWILSAARVTLKWIFISLSGLAITAAMILLALKPGFQVCAVYTFKGAYDGYQMASPKVREFSIWLLPIAQQACEAICIWTSWSMAKSRHFLISRLNREQEYAEPHELVDLPIATPAPERYGDEDFFASKSEFERLTSEAQRGRLRHEAYLAEVAAYARSLPRRPPTIPSAPIPRSYFIEQARYPPQPLEYEPQRPPLRGQKYPFPPILKKLRKSASASPASSIGRPTSLAPWRRMSRSIAPELETRSVPKLDSTRSCLKQQPTGPAQTHDHKVAPAAPNEAKHVRWNEPCISEIALCTALINPGFVPLYPTASTTDMFHATDLQGNRYQGWSAFDYNNVTKYIQELTADKHEACKSVADRESKSVGYYIAVVLHNIMQSQEGQNATQGAWNSISASATEEQVRAFKVATELRTSYAPMAPTQQEPRLRTPHETTPAFPATPSASFLPRNTQAFHQSINALQTQVVPAPPTPRPFTPIPAAPPVQMAPVAQAAVPTQPPQAAQAQLMSEEAIARCKAYMAIVGDGVALEFITRKGWTSPLSAVQGNTLLKYLANAELKHEALRKTKTPNVQGTHVPSDWPTANSTPLPRHSAPVQTPKGVSSQSRQASNSQGGSSGLATPANTTAPPVTPAQTSTSSGIPPALPSYTPEQAKNFQSIRDCDLKLRSNSDGVPFRKVILTIVQALCKKERRKDKVDYPQTIDDIDNDFWVRLNLDKDELQFVHSHAQSQLQKFKDKHQSG